MPKSRCKGGSYNSAALQGGSYNSAALRGGSYNSAALRGGSYNSAALRGGSYNSAALRGGSYNSAALRGGRVHQLPELPYDSWKMRASKWGRPVLHVDGLPPRRPRTSIRDMLLRRAVFPPSLAYAVPMTRGIVPSIPHVARMPAGNPQLPLDTRDVVKAPPMRQAPLKYMLDNGLTRADLE